MTAHILLPARLADQLAALARTAYPDEACALLVGAPDSASGTVPMPDLRPALRRIAEIVPARNVAADPRRGFEVDPATQVALRRRLRENPDAGVLLGHWHSHPDGPAIPSRTDAAMIYEPGLCWLISPVIKGQPGPPRAWLPDAAPGAEPRAMPRAVPDKMPDKMSGAMPIGGPTGFVECTLTFLTEAN